MGSRVANKFTNTDGDILKCSRQLAGCQNPEQDHPRSLDYNKLSLATYTFKYIPLGTELTVGTVFPSLYLHDPAQGWHKFEAQAAVKWNRQSKQHSLRSSKHNGSFSGQSFGQFCNHTVSSFNLLRVIFLQGKKQNTESTHHQCFLQAKIFLFSNKATYKDFSGKPWPRTNIFKKDHYTKDQRQGDLI